ncbi:hypothetical protein TIFTF001_025960 [Ficus carica]|uniref:Uncharacterized protein n=1 Tax=Ficus carica TaxID=3494 RepID=A0AA88ARJ9_FICCA|nr:hypothetical protein TIFTF001_025960 [Ficus carica]
MFSVIFVMTTTATKFRAAFGLNNVFLHELVLTFEAEFTGVMIAITITAYKDQFICRFCFCQGKDLELLLLHCYFGQISLVRLMVLQFAQVVEDRIPERLFCGPPEVLVLLSKWSCFPFSKRLTMQLNFIGILSDLNVVVILLKKNFIVPWKLKAKWPDAG